MSHQRNEHNLVDQAALEGLLLSYEVSSEDLIDPAEIGILDPFATALEIAQSGCAFDEWQRREQRRQIQKTMMNRLGSIQQDIIGLLHGWQSNQVHQRGESAETLPDILCEERKLIGEVKNKHNTTNSGSSSAVHQNLAHFLAQDRFFGYTAVVVNVIVPLEWPTSWKPYGASRNHRPDIINLGGRAFYALATGPVLSPPPSGTKEREFLEEDGRFDWFAIDKMAQQFFEAVEKIFPGTKVDAQVRNAVGVALKS